MMRVKTSASQSSNGESHYGYSSTYPLVPSTTESYLDQLHSSIDEVSLNARSYQQHQYLPSSSSLLSFTSRDLTTASRQDQHAFPSHTEYNAREQIDIALPTTSAMTPYLQDGYNTAVMSYQNLGSMPMMGGIMSQPRLPNSIHSRKPKVESKPMIDPVDNKQLCTFFMRTGTCAYGDRCRYKHPKDRPPPQVNSRGFPVREGETDCEHYIKRGWCAFGVTCKFNHPESTAFIPMPYQQPGYVPMPGMLTVPYIPAYSYPAYTGAGLASPNMYAQPGAYASQPAAMGTGLKNGGGSGDHNSSSDAVDEAAQGLEALSLRGGSPPKQ